MLFSALRHNNAGLPQLAQRVRDGRNLYLEQFGDIAHRQFGVVAQKPTDLQAGDVADNAKCVRTRFQLACVCQLMADVSLVHNISIEQMFKS